MPGVYIGTSPLKSAYVGTTPVKEIYVGTTKVRPVWKYSYDFVGKTTSSVEADGWTFFQNKSYATFNSYGMNSTTQDKQVAIALETLSGVMPNAKKVTMELNSVWVGRLRAGLYMYSSYTSSAVNGATGPFVSAAENRIYTLIYGSETYTSTTPSGEITLTTVIDLENGTRTTTGTNGYSRSGTLSSTDVTNIRNNSIGICCLTARGGGGNSSGGLKSISITIE